MKLTSLTQSPSHFVPTVCEIHMHDPMNVDRFDLPGLRVAAHIAIMGDFNCFNVVAIDMGFFLVWYWHELKNIL